MRERRRAGGAWILLVGCLATTLTGCGTTTSAHGKTLRLPLYGDAGAPDPARANTPPALFLSSLLYSGLVRFSPDLHVIPELAVSLPTVSTDGRTYTFAIRQDARFGSGRHCTAKDIAYSLTRALSPEERSARAHRYLGNIQGARKLETGRSTRLSGVSVLNRLTLRIRLRRPDADFLSKLAFPVATAVDRYAVGAYRSGKWISHPAGTGAWAVAGRERDGSLNLIPRRHFYGARLQLDALMLVPVSGVARSFDLYHKGDLDASLVPTERYTALAIKSDFHTARGLEAYYALPHGSEGPALAAALDRSELEKQIPPQLSPLSGIVPPSIPDYVSSPPTVDQAVSGTALNHPSIRLQSLPGSSLPAGLMTALYLQWPRARAGGTRVDVIHQGFDLPDPGLWLGALLKTRHSAWLQNLLVRAQELTNDPVTRMSAYSRAENWAIENGFVIPLATRQVSYLIKPFVQSLEVTPLGLMPENNNWSSVNLS